MTILTTQSSASINDVEKGNLNTNIHSDAGGSLKPHHDPAASYKEACRERRERNIAAKRIELLKSAYRSSKIKKRDLDRVLNDVKDGEYQLHSDGRDLVSASLWNGCLGMASNFARIRETNNNDDCDQILQHVETVMLTYFALRDAKNMRQFVSITLLAIKAQCRERSLCNSVVRAIFGTDTEEGIASYFLGKSPGLSKLHSDSDKKVGTQETTFQKFMSDFWAFGNSIVQAKDSVAVGKISSLMGILLALGFISESKKLEFSVGGLKIFRFQAAKGYKNVTDLVDVLMDTGAFFCERGYKCFLSGSMDPMFFDSKEDLQFDKDYTTLTAYFDCVKIGDYRRSPWMDERDFELHLNNALIYCERLHDTVDKSARSFVCKRLETLKKMQAEFHLLRSSGGLRPSPFSFCVFGTSSVGKSTITNNLLTYSLQTIAREKGKKDYVVDPNVICTLNEQDPYHSDYMGHTQAVLLDDLGNASFESTNINPTVNIIHFINNIRRTAIRAEAELKGKIWIEPLVVAATTNVRDMWAKRFTNEPVSALRRFKIHIEAIVKPGFESGGTTFVDGEKLAAEADAGNITPDAWLFTLYEYVGLTQGEDAPQKAVRRAIYYVNDSGESVPATRVDFGVVMDIFRERIIKHLRCQESVVKTSEATFARTLCPHGRYHEWCKECSRELTPEEDLALEEEVPPLELDTDVLSEVDGEIDISSCEGSVTSLPGVEMSPMPDPESAEFYSDSKALGGRPAPPPPPANTPMNRRLGDINRAPPPPPNPMNRGLGNSPSPHPPVVNVMNRPLGEGDDLPTLEKWIQECDKLSHIPALDWVSWLPKKIFDKSWVQWGITFLRSKEYASQVKWLGWLYMWSLTASTWFCGASVFLPGISFFGLCSFAVASARKTYLVKRISKSRALMPSLVKRIRDGDIAKGKQICYFFGAFLSIYAVYKTVKHLSKVADGLTADGGEFSLPQEKENVWLSPELEPLPEGLNTSHSADDVAGVIVKQLAYIEIADRETGKKESANGLFIDSNCLLIPNHMKPTETMDLTVRMAALGTLTGKNFTCMLSPEQCITIVPTTRGKVTSAVLGDSESDLCLCYIASSGSMKALWKFFPESLSKRSIMTRMVWKDADASSKEWKTCFSQFGNAKTARAKFTNGAYYKLSEPGFGGLCMATHIHAVASKAYIAGFHLASDRGTTCLNCAEMVTRQDLEAARDVLDLRSNVVLTSSSGLMPTEAYGIDYTPEPNIPMKSPTRYQTSGQVDVYGSLPQYSVRPSSSVIESPISEAVGDIMGVPQQWGPPANCRRPGERIPAWAPYQKYLAGAGNATQEFPAGVMARAMDDYLAQLDEVMDTPEGKACLARVRPLTDVEIVSGIDGVKFVDAMKPKTSMGFPLNRPKNEFLIDLDPQEYDQACPRDIDPETKALAQQLIAAYRRRERGYPTFKGCTKDEPKKLSSLKARLFQASPAYYQWVLRKYNLTICHFLSSFALGTECAVGTNSHSPSWHVLDEWLTEFGEDQIIAGDFVAYDQHMSPNMTLLSFKVFEHIAKRAGYSEDDLLIMRGIASDCVYPVMILNGDLIQLYGSNPSGQNLTVYTNSIVNSLYHRCVFFTLYPNYVGRFRDAVHLITYGDDSKQGVDKKYSDYNHTRVQRVFLTYGIEYTMADKEAESVPFIHHTEASFLKRWSRFDSSYHYTREDGRVCEGMWIAMLDEESIFKSLHCNLASADASPEQVAAQCMDQAMGEWFFYGRQVFEERHAQLKSVIARTGLCDVVPPTFYDRYDARESVWLTKYNITKV